MALDLSKFNVQAPDLSQYSTMNTGNYFGNLSDIEAKFNSVNDASFAAARNQLGVDESQAYRDMAANQNSALDTIRRNFAQSIATGASRGMQAAQEQAAIAGLQDDNAKLQMDMIGNRQSLVDQELQARAQSALQAYQLYNSNQQTKLNADTQLNVGTMDALANIFNAQAGLEGNKATAYANYEGQGLVADAQKAAAQTQANATMEAARMAQQGPMQDMYAALQNPSDPNSQEKFVLSYMAQYGGTKANAVNRWNEFMSQKNKEAQGAQANAILSQAFGNIPNFTFAPDGKVAAPTSAFDAIGQKFKINK